MFLAACSAPSASAFYFDSAAGIPRDTLCRGYPEYHFGVVSLPSLSFYRYLIPSGKVDLRTSGAGRYSMDFLGAPFRFSCSQPDWSLWVWKSSGSASSLLTSEMSCMPFAGILAVYLLSTVIGSQNYRAKAHSQQPDESAPAWSHARAVCRDPSGCADPHWLRPLCIRWSAPLLHHALLFPGGLSHSLVSGFLVLRRSRSSRKPLTPSISRAPLSGLLLPASGSCPGWGAMVGRCFVNPLVCHSRSHRASKAIFPIGTT